MSEEVMVANTVTIFTKCLDKCLNHQCIEGHLQVNWISADVRMGDMDMMDRAHFKNVSGTSLGSDAFRGLILMMDLILALVPNITVRIGAMGA